MEQSGSFLFPLVLFWTKVSECKKLSLPPTFPIETSQWEWKRFTCLKAEKRFEMVKLTMKFEIFILLKQRKISLPNFYFKKTIISFSIHTLIRI